MELNTRPGSDGCTDPDPDMVHGAPRSDPHRDSDKGKNMSQTLHDIDIGLKQE
jgi:hypothetical protein